MDKKERLHFFKTNYGKIVPSRTIDWLLEQGYFTAPASSKFHGAYNGGLFDHCINVTDKLLEYTWKLELKWQREESPYYVGLFHDLCKMDEYLADSIGYSKKKASELSLVGHGDKSIMLLAQQLSLTEEEVMCIRYHMGAYQTEEWEQFDQAIRKYPNVLYTHTADMHASKIMDHNGKIITYKKLLEAFSDTGKDTSQYEAFRDEYVEQGYVIVDDEE